MEERKKVEARDIEGFLRKEYQSVIHRRSSLSGVH